MMRQGTLRADTERQAVARGLRRQARRLRYLANDVGDKHTVRAMSRRLDAQAAALDGKIGEPAARREPGGDRH